MSSTIEKLHQAVAHHQAGRLAQAEPLYREILAADPRQPDALHLLGVIAYQVGRHDVAIDLIRQAIAVSGAQAAYYNNLGTVYRAAGRLAEAADTFGQALRLDPNNVEAHNNLGTVLQDQGRSSEALASYEQALRLLPGHAEASNNSAIVLQGQGRLAEAQARYEQAVRLKPDYADAYCNLGTVLRARGKLAEAAAAIEQSLRLKPDSATAHNELGNVIQDQGNLLGALDRYRQAVRLNPNFSEAHANLGSVLKAQGMFAEARVEFERAMTLSPSDGLRIKAALMLPVIPESAADLQAQRARLEQEVDRMLGQRLEIKDPVNDVGGTVFNLAYHGLNDRDLQVKIARLYAQVTPSLSYVAPHCQTPAESRNAEQRISIGFISKYFYNHSIAKAYGGLIRNLSRDRFRVVLLRLPGPEDAMLQSLSESAEVVTLPLDLAAARQRIADERLDVLFYTDIGMEPRTYFLAFARLAPVQCVTWGHPVTTGIPAIDYFISSVELEPADAPQHYSEQLIRLPNINTFYYPSQVPSSMGVKAQFGLDPAAHIYTCPQNLFKMHPDFDRLLGEVLRADPQGRLLLFRGVHDHITDLLAARLRRSIPQEFSRVQFLPRLALEDFLRVLAASDVLLDTTHFSGGITTFDGFNVGTPIVSMPGGLMRSRQTYACYRKMGIMDCVASSPEEYVRIAVGLGTDLAWRNEVRSRILDRKHVLYENEAAVRELEGFLADAVQAARAGRRLIDPAQSP
jgi:protein O-GlcNAc transferase